VTVEPLESEKWPKPASYAPRKTGYRWFRTTRKFAR
jgi:hypothetical protein